MLASVDHPRAAICAAALAVALVAVPTGGLPARAAGRSAPREAQGTALRDAGERLGAIDLPPGSRPVKVLGRDLRLDGPVVLSGSPNLVQRHSLFVSSRSREAVVAWFRTHPPAGSKLTESGSAEVGEKVTVRYLGFEWPELLGTVRERTATVGVASTGSSRSAFRVDSDAVWIRPRSPGETVPEAARYLEMELRSKGHVRRSKLLSDPIEVAPIRELIDGFDVSQPGEGFCPPIPASGKELDLRFRANPDGPVLAEAVQMLPPWCDRPLKFFVGGQRRTNLEGGQELVERVLPVLEGIPPD